MQELNMQEIDDVSGGLDFKTLVWAADQVADFFKGFGAGWDAAEAAK